MRDHIAILVVALGTWRQGRHKHFGPGAAAVVEPVLWLDGQVAVDLVQLDGWLQKRKPETFCRARQVAVAHNWRLAVGDVFRHHETGVRIMPTATISYPSELTTALGKRPDEAVRELQLMAALRLYESGRVSSGLAAEVAGIGRVEFLALCGQYGVTVFQQTADEIATDTEAALHARRG